MKKKPKTLEQKKAEVEFYPVQKINSYYAILDIEKFREEKKKLTDSHEFLRTMIPKGKYDIDYVINLLGIIIDNCGPLSSTLSIKESCKRLQGFLKVEKCPSHKDPRVLVTCPVCDDSVVVSKSISKHWKCPCIKNTKLLD